MTSSTIRLILIFSIVSVSCHQEEDNLTDNVNYIKESYSIGRGESFTYHLGNFSSEGNIKITEQAQHFDISEIKTGIGGIDYEYKPQNEFLGTDYVEITLTTTVGNNEVNQITVFQLSITIESD